jgi:hypothetical protein
MAVPQWLLHLIDKCLKKKPEARFETGMALHDFITANSATGVANEAASSNSQALVPPEITRLKAENEALQKQVLQYQKTAADSTREIVALKTTLGNRDAELNTLRRSTASYAATPPTINAWEERNNFYYTEFTNSRGQTVQRLVAP